MIGGGDRWGDNYGIPATPGPLGPGYVPASPEVCFPAPAKVDGMDVMLCVGTFYKTK